jgi:hypothetical protein
MDLFRFMTHHGRGIFRWILLSTTLHASTIMVAQDQVIHQFQFMEGAAAVIPMVQKGIYSLVHEIDPRSRVSFDADRVKIMIAGATAEELIDMFAQLSAGGLTVVQDGHAPALPGIRVMQAGDPGNDQGQPAKAAPTGSDPQDR